MYITKGQLDERLNRAELLINQRERKERKRKLVDESGEVVAPGEIRLSEEERKLIATLAVEGSSSQKEIAELMGVSSQTVSNNSRGLVSPTIGVDPELKETVNEAKDRKVEKDKKIQDQLLTNLSAALGHVANNLHNTDATEASRIAVDMSKILDKVSGSGDGKHRTAIIINVPQMREEKQYQTIEV